MRAHVCVSPASHFNFCEAGGFYNETNILNEKTWLHTCNTSSQDKKREVFLFYDEQWNELLA